MKFSETFQQDGFLVQHGIYSPAELDQISSVLTANRPVSNAIWDKALCASSARFFEFATHPAILGTLRSLLGPDIILWGGSYLRRSPGQVHLWHTDIETSRIEGGFVTVWIGLRNTNQNSALQVIPGSHRFGVPLQKAIHDRSRIRTDTTAPEIAGWAKEYDPNSNGVFSPEVGDGDAIFFDGRLWHGSENTNPDLERTAFLFQYARADVPVRIPDYGLLTWPFTFLDHPRPPCVSVSGTPEMKLNLISEAPPELGEDPEPLESGVYPVDLDAEIRNGRQIQQYPMAAGCSPNLQGMSIHYSVLAPGHSPHPPHAHVDEELLVVLKGRATLHYADPSGQLLPEVVAAGDGIYYPAFHQHTIENTSDEPVIYVMLKWVAAEHEPVARELDLQRWSVPSLDEGVDNPAPVSGVECFTGPSDHLRCLHSHITTILPNGGYEAHRDEHDVAIILFEGEIVTNGETMRPGDLVWHPANSLHDMQNLSPHPARYLVFEFHGKNCLPVEETVEQNGNEGENTTLPEIAPEKEPTTGIWSHIKRALGMKG